MKKIMENNANLISRNPGPYSSNYTEFTSSCDNLPAYSINQLQELGAACSKTRPQTTDSEFQTSAIYTYFGQFIAHDMVNISDSHVPITSGFNTTNIPLNSVTKALSLESVYGADDEVLDSDFLFTTIKDDSIECDIPRDAFGKPQIPDIRNDQHLIISQFHLQWLKLHNLLVRTGIEANEARVLIVELYRYLVVFDFLKTILYQPIWELFFKNFSSAPFVKFATATMDRSRIPAEFHAAAFRFGHGLIRPSYIIRENGTFESLKTLFEMTSHVQINSNNPIDEKFRVQWDVFSSNDTLNLTGEQILNVPHGQKPQDSLITKNLKRAHNFGVADAQSNIIAYKNRLHDNNKEILNKLFDNGDWDIKEFLFRGIPNIKKNVTNYEVLYESTPLWFYLQREAWQLAKLKDDETKNYKNQSGLLGPVGSLIVGQTFSNFVPVSSLTNNANDLPIIGRVNTVRDIFGLIA